MTKKKFKVRVTRTDEYEVEIDTNVWNEKEIQNWAEVFHDADNVKDISEIVASRVNARDGYSDYFEGFGRLKMSLQLENERRPVPQSSANKYNESIAVTIISEGDDIEYQTEEIDE